ncbi:MAG: hypothetical protein EXX96DRAFT_536935 [Benjaminiella poitrasii]|nr:MAG: hypothetical protein EXX96DRAFT_536935 [Benjaminiella poitrasii]
MVNPEQHSNQDLASDILHIQGVTMAPKKFRQCVFVIDELLSCYDCFQFLIPVPPTAIVYHNEIKNPMDFRTLERNLFNNKYATYEDFVADLSLIWNNAKLFHRSFDTIYQQAENLCKRYESLVAFLNGGEQPFYLSTPITDKDIISNTILPEEKVVSSMPSFPMYKEIQPKRKSNLYFVQAFSEEDWRTKRIRGFSNVRLLFEYLNASFFHYIKTNGVERRSLPLPRFYIAKNRTLLNQARTDPDGALAILYNVQIKPMENQAKNDLMRLQTTVILCKPMGETHNFDESTMDKSNKYEFCPKAWLKLQILNIVHHVETVINADIDRNYFKKAYNTFRLSTKIPADPKKIRNQEIAKHFVRSILEPVSTAKPPTTVQTPPSIIDGPRSRRRTASVEVKKEESPKPVLLPKPQPQQQSKTNESMIQRPVIRISTPPSMMNKLNKSKSTSPIVVSSLSSLNSNDHENSTSGAKRRRRSLSPEPPAAESKNIIRIPSNFEDNNHKESSPAADSQQTTTIRLVLNRCNSQEVVACQEEGKEKNESSVGKEIQKEEDENKISDDHGYESSETASYEYSEEEEEEEDDDSKKQTPVSTNEKEEEEEERKKSVGSNSISVASLLNDKNPFIPSGDSKMANTNPSESFERYLEKDDSDISQSTGNKEIAHTFDKEYYINISKELWQKVVQYSNEKGVPIVDIDKYNVSTSSLPNAEGFFKHVFFLSHDKRKVVQTFRHMTITQRTTEIVGLLALKGLPHMGQITEVLQESHGEIIGLCMERYEKTLKQYTHAHSHHRLTAYQKMDLIIQMLQSLETIHGIGLAHRDLSEVNFMVNETNEKLRDGSPKAELFLIDFGKSTFTDATRYRHWWVEQPPVGINNGHEYDGEIVPRTQDELDRWSQQLPWIRSKPDHGYKLYRSIQTLPKSRIDTDDLPWLVNPIAEDLYSIGTIIWKTFSETEPWYGILDTDLKALRETVGQDYHIERALEREVAGELSRELLLKFLKVSPDQRQTATDVLAWLQDINIQDGLIAEWEQHAPVGRQKRHAKALFRYDEEQAVDNERKKQKQL